MNAADALRACNCSACCGGIAGLCGACAELAGQRDPPGVVPCLCALRGGLLKIGVTAVALAMAMPEAQAPSPLALPRYRRPRNSTCANRKEVMHDTIPHMT